MAPPWSNGQSGAQVLQRALYSDARAEVQADSEAYTGRDKGAAVAKGWRGAIGCPPKFIDLD